MPAGAWLRRGAMEAVGAFTSPTFIRLVARHILG
jgi:hypothetical protein